MVDLKFAVSCLNRSSSLWMLIFLKQGVVCLLFRILLMYIGCFPFFLFVCKDLLILIITSLINLYKRYKEVSLTKRIVVCWVNHEHRLYNKLALVWNFVLIICIQIRIRIHKLLIHIHYSVDQVIPELVQGFHLRLKKCFRFSLPCSLYPKAPYPRIFISLFVGN